MLTKREKKLLTKADSPTKFDPVNHLGECLMRNNPNYIKDPGMSEYQRVMRDVTEELKIYVPDTICNRKSCNKTQVENSKRHENEDRNQGQCCIQRRGEMKQQREKQYKSRVGILDRQRTLALLEQFYDQSSQMLRSLLRNPRQWPFIEFEEIDLTEFWGNMDNQKNIYEDFDKVLLKMNELLSEKHDNKTESNLLENQKDQPKYDEQRTSIAPPHPPKQQREKPADLGSQRISNEEQVREPSREQKLYIEAVIEEGAITESNQEQGSSRELIVEQRPQRGSTAEQGSHKASTAEQISHRGSTAEQVSHRESVMEQGPHKVSTAEQRSRRESRTEQRSHRGSTAEQGSQRKSTVEQRSHRGSIAEQGSHKESTIEHRSHRGSTTEQGSRRESMIEQRSHRGSTAEQESHRESVMEQGPHRRSTAEQRSCRESMIEPHRVRAKTTQRDNFRTTGQRLNFIIRKRQNAFQIRQELLLKALLQKWDSDGSGFLDLEEVDKLLYTYKHGMEKESMKKAKMKDPELATPLFITSSTSGEINVADDSEGVSDNPRTMKNYADEDFVPPRMSSADVILPWNITTSLDR
ncbi:EF-hand calcium-binding domain-containing protein 5 [Heterocephalus glaber]|uniref:EF-hand calcium-binding domain-containing protein 5 n=1 Tax=Heterocephalus glaber TaxID=10181 RepID=G5BVP6_HETGA|nr:EF-hand calcium-binding domain-containing protein 5 [Heterocephalus glaber]